MAATHELQFMDKTPHHSEVEAPTKAQHDAAVLARLGKKSVLEVGATVAVDGDEADGSPASLWLHIDLRLHVYHSRHLGRKSDVRSSNPDTRSMLTMPVCSPPA